MGGGQPTEARFRDAEQWTDKSYADRRDDVRAIMKVLRDSAALAARVDVNQLGPVGHSLAATRSSASLGRGRRGGRPASKLCLRCRHTLSRSSFTRRSPGCRRR